MEGSTEIPCPTNPLAALFEQPTVTTVNQTAETDDVITTIEIAGWFTNDNPGEPAPTYASGTLPSGLSLDATTGDITGTVGETANTASPYSIEVSANYGCYTIEDDFTYTIGLGIVPPGSIGAGPAVWYKFRDPTTLYTDDAMTTNPSSDSDRLRAVANQGSMSGQDAHAGHDDTSQDTDRPYWRATGDDGGGSTVDFQRDPDTHVGFYKSTIGAAMADQSEYTIACVVQMPTVTTDQKQFWGSTNGHGCWPMIQNAANSALIEYRANQGSGTTDADSLVALGDSPLLAGTWWLVIQQVSDLNQPARSRVFWNGVEDKSAGNHDAGTNGHDIQGIRVGWGGSPGSSNDGNGLDAEMGEFFIWEHVFTSTDRDNLLEWARSEYSKLTNSFPDQNP